MNPKARHIRTPTPEQAKVLDAPDRVRLVRAAPGCGKTWLVAEAIRRAIEGWSGSGGVAALSFTNVGGDEIRRAAGFDLVHPHFVGTLDSFAYRYIVKPFAHVLGPDLQKLHLLAGDGAVVVKFDPRAALVLPDSQKRVSLLDLHFIGGFRADAKLALREYGRASPLSPTDCATVRVAKLKLWKTWGWISHSDVTYIAGAILRDANHGARICKWISARFPFLIVDELQDTGWYLGEIVRAILSAPAARGLLVGDPDQAIYEFNGARPELFDTFLDIPGCREYPVRQSLRCPSKVTNVANHLISVGVPVEPEPARGEGRAILVTIDDPTVEMPEIRRKLSQADGKRRQIVTRSNETIFGLEGAKLNEVPEFASRPITLIHSGARNLYAGKSKYAIDNAKSAILYILFDHVTADVEQLMKAGITPHALRMAAAKLIEASRPAGPDEDAYTWSLRMRTLMLYEIKERGWERSDGSAAKVKAPAKKISSEKILPTLAHKMPQTNEPQAKIRTVHAVKGETHDVTLFYVPAAKGRRRCVSDSWWSQDSDLSEERRIAFVAATRSRGTFVLCADATTVANLNKLQPKFVRAFDQMSADRFLTLDI